MYRHIAFSLLLAVTVSINAQTVNLRGTVSNKAGKPIANAIVTLVKQAIRTRPERTAPTLSLTVLVCNCRY